MANVQEYVGKKVSLTLEDDGEQVDVIGTIESANSLGFVFKPFGSPKISLYETSQVLSVDPAPEKEPELKARRLDPVTEDNVKRHLVDRHGYPLADINEMSATDAFEFHNDSVDHEALSHFHAARPVKAAHPGPRGGETMLPVSVDDDGLEDDDDDEIDF